MSKLSRHHEATVPCTLLQLRTPLLVPDQTVEDGENLLAVDVDALQGFPEWFFEVSRFQPFIQHRRRHVNVLSQRFHGMSAQKQSIEKGRLPLRGQWIEVVSRRHNDLSENVSIAVALGFDQVVSRLLPLTSNSHMPTLIPHPSRIEAAGSKPKLIEEYIGRVNSKDQGVSVAHMHSPAGWQEPGQTPEFDEFTLVLDGQLRVEFRGGSIDVRAGQAIIAHKGEWVRYSTPDASGAVYIAVCVPAFSMETVHRDA